jgi:hypothetical protein
LSFAFFYLLGKIESFAVFFVVEKSFRDEIVIVGRWMSEVLRLYILCMIELKVISTWNKSIASLVVDVGKHLFVRRIINNLVYIVRFYHYKRYYIKKVNTKSSTYHLL